MVRERSLGSVLFDVCNYALLILAGLFCLLPLVHVLAVSLSERWAVMADSVTLWPVGFNTGNYREVLLNPAFMRAFHISLLRTTLGTALNLAIVVLTAYPLSLPREELPEQGVFKGLLLFAMLFSGGLIPWYLAIRSLGMLDKIWALILPGMVSMWLIIIVVNFFRQLPREMAEAATVDGASHWDILFRIHVPLSRPVLATATLFSAVAHWNSWFDGLILMNQRNYPLQSYLRTILLTNDLSQLTLDPSLLRLVSVRGLRSAELLVATVPILLVYPFVQRHFVTGITLGAVKG